MLQSLDEHKGIDIVSIPLDGKSSIADFMVIASGSSSRQVAALAEHLEVKLKRAGVPILGKEGLARADWVLLDTAEVIVHLFRCLLYTSPSPRDREKSRMPSSA